MTLFILAVSVLAVCYAISVCWKLIRFVLTLPFKIGTKPYEHDYFADDETAIWLKGKNGRYFRYDLRIDARDDARKEEQMDELKEFFTENVLDRESTST